jgi:dipeptidase E
MSLRLLLLSNSTNHGRGYLEHAWPTVQGFFTGARRIAFVPFALADHAAYLAKARVPFAGVGIEVLGLTPDARGLSRLAEVDGVFVGGGNTFRLLRALQDSGLLEGLVRRARDGMPYMGASAGTNVATPSLKTTNDMPIVQPRSFEALNLVPFQINPHYIDPDPATRHMGETRDERLREFHEENTAPVVGLREGAWLEVTGGELRLEGENGARLFRRGEAPQELTAGRHDELLKG